jgi:hypothetical protein
MAILEVNISDDLYQAVQRFRNQLDVSQICEKALTKEVHRLNRKLIRQTAKDPPTNPYWGGG